MRISELLTAMASWLESPNNEAFLLSEYDEQSLKVVAEACVKAATELKIAAQTVEEIEPPVESVITSESIEELAGLAAVLDSSGDDGLKKQASVIDELLLTIAAGNKYAERKDLLNDRLEQIKKNYQEPKEILDQMNSKSQAIKAIDKSKMTDHIEINEQPLSTRTCLQHPGAQLARVGEHQWRCELDGKIYNYDTGFKLDNGVQVPGGDVSLQTQNQISQPYHSIYDDRNGRLGQNS
jgi:hypothetical protein